MVFFGFDGFGIICQGSDEVGGLTINGWAASTLAIVLRRRTRDDAITGEVDTFGGSATGTFGDMTRAGKTVVVRGEAGCALDVL